MIDRHALRLRPLLIASLCACSVIGTASSFQATWAQQAKEPTKPTAEQVLRRTADFYKNAKSIAVEIEREQKIGGLSVKYPVTVAFERPNRITLRMENGPSDFTIVSDGKKMFISIAGLKRYTESNAPDSLDDLSTNPLVMGLLNGTMIIELCADDPYAKLMEGVKSAKHVGVETIDGVKLHHLAFEQEQVDWEIWIPIAGDPTIRRMTADLSKTMANLPAGVQLKNQKFEMIENFKNWRVNQAFDAKTFVFTPPKDAQKVENLLDLPEAGEEEGPSPLLGKSAPDIDLRLLEKGNFRLKEHRNSHVVMLDFWATWCPPCVRELPILAEVAKEYKDKGVVFCAVNVQEEPKEIRDFLEEKQLDLPVALDSAGKVGKAYNANAIPLLVLVDKKGIVQSVHVGFAPDIKKILKKELDTLLEGKDLAKGAHKEPKTEKVHPEK